jgi:hypothetical protein
MNNKDDSEFEITDCFGFFEKGNPYCELCKFRALSAEVVRLEGIL